jgi:fructose transport system substrate-binding protein
VQLNILGDISMNRLTVSFILIIASLIGVGFAQDEPIRVGLITKTETNPFFVKMREGAAETAEELGVELFTAAGEFDGDNASQVTAIENMIAAGVQGILITPSDTRAIVPTIERAREQGVVVIALDTPTEPESAVDALFATDNFAAGVLIGEYAAAMSEGETPVIAMLGLTQGITVGTLRHNGFLTGFGLADTDSSETDLLGGDMPEVVCIQDTQGDQARGQTAMENCLIANPDINIVYTINEPAAFGAYTALEAAGRADDVLIVSVDGGCAGVRGVVNGEIGATSQQYPLRMAALGVEAIVEYANTGVAPEGYTDTGVNLITDEAVEGVESEDTEFGLANCWG